MYSIEYYMCVCKYHILVCVLYIYLLYIYIGDWGTSKGMSAFQSRDERINGSTVPLDRFSYFTMYYSKQFGSSDKT